MDRRGDLVWPDGDVVAFDIISREVEGICEILKHVKGRRVAVQAGGNAGTYPRALAPHFEAVYSFEPVRELFECLVVNAPTVHCFNAALGDSARGIEMDMKHYPANSGAAFVGGQGWTRCMTLDSLGLEACDLLMLDVEGFELPALKGAARTIGRYRPVIVAEMNGHGSYYGDTDDSVRNWLRRLGYTRALSLASDEVWV